MLANGRSSAPDSTVELLKKVAWVTGFVSGNVMDASGCLSLVQLNQQGNKNPSDNNKVDYLSSIYVLPGRILVVLIAIFPIGISLAQTPNAQALKPVANDYVISVGELRVPDKAWSHLRAADRAFSQGNLKEAEEEADRALLVYPQCAAAFSIKAFVELATKNSRTAVQYATRATSLDPHSAKTFVALAMAYNADGDYPKAQRAAYNALAIQPESWQARLELAKSLYGEGQFDAALGELSSLRIDFPDVHLVRGNVLMHLGRRREGANEFKLFIAEAPNDRRVKVMQEIIARMYDPSTF